MKLDYQKIIKRGLLFLGVVILGSFIYSINFSNLPSILERFTSKSMIYLFSIAILLTFVNLLLKSYRWKVLAQNMTEKIVSLKFSFLSIMGGIAAASFIPGRVEFAKPLLLKSELDIPLTKSFSALIIERALDLLTLLIFLIPSLFLVSFSKIINPINIYIFVIIFFGLSCSVIIYPNFYKNISLTIINIIPLPQKIKEKLMTFASHLFESYATLKSKNAITLVLISLIANGLEILRFHFILTMLGINTTLAATCFIFVVAIIVGVLSTIPGGIGVTEVSAAALIAHFDANSQSSLIKTSILVDRIVSYYILILLGSVVLVFQQYFFKKPLSTLTSQINNDQKKSEES